MSFTIHYVSMLDKCEKRFFFQNTNGVFASTVVAASVRFVVSQEVRNVVRDRRAETTATNRTLVMKGDM